ncbi:MULTISPECIES: AI-2E family transporter [unclassified Mesorhizobium]|uniref:AI-2E family transporter n=1 Tax=unclassified Mesorhizobium TaxID=325217 RepID=UPI000FCBDADF|nr:MULTISPECIES: AI-2E family transporter [unclassified Mesorhizobium]RUU64521.1 AI-2E family transporter [Mesorhizobium sp. M7A.T.Ca.TU.009.01.1.1]RUU90190.1 AI-2E family transporter [Mesorhizobium sp. M7A.T.Ca.TU.009.01.1.2]RUT84932.1 AI-2E family transporter [Mesorhizobium sp. M7A.T.Ca.US.000.02.1.1]RUT91305.1 AI-2E family transporter [Mesorhizobium sp. M7A.T.Ca.US.000.02.2.1]RUT99579.1 AI-2E family transporter [Mesorhizobium sp. M7A.T.Ca.TU.009.02.1.1]
MKTEHAALGRAIADESDSRVAARADTHLMRSLLVGIFLFMAIYALYFARAFFMPVILAFLLALTLTPIVRLLRRHGISEVVSATLLVLLSICIFASVGYLLSGPIIDLINNTSSIGQQLAERLAQLRRPLEKIMQISHQIEQLTQTSQEPGIQRVAMAQSGILSAAASNILSAGTGLTIIFVLSLFLLASGTMFYEKIIQSFASLSEKKRALRVVYDVEREISHYLLTVTIINAGLGTVIALGLWALGMPNPLVWGAAAALLNFLPYVGALITIVLVTVMALISFDTIFYALLAPAFVILCDIVEGQFVTPMVVGRRLEINAVAILIAIAFWSWLWGFVGALMAVPLLVVIKVFCDHFDGLSHVGNFLAAQHAVVVEEDDIADPEAIKG